MRLGRAQTDRHSSPLACAGLTAGSPMPEPTVPAAYVRARWAYSELLSGRPFRGTGVQELKRKALEHVPFDDLSGDERDQLEQAWYRVRGVPTFTNAFAGIATFEFVHWSKEQLALLIHPK